MVQQTPINNNLPYRRQSSLGGNKVMRFGSPLDDNTALLWGTVTQVYYRKGTVEFSIAGMPAVVDNSGSDGTYAAPIPIDFYGVDNNGKPFAKTRLIQKGNKVLVAFVNGSSSNPVILGVYPDNAQSYELISPSLSNTVQGNTQDDIEQTMNQIEVDPHHQLIYKAGNGDLAKTMQGHSFLLVSGTDRFALSDIQRTYKDISYFYGNFGDSDDETQAGLIDSNTPQAPEWLLVHENNTSADGTLDTHLTRFYVNHKGEVQIVLTDTKDTDNLVVLQGSKDKGFTLMKSFDGDADDSKDYVKFNIGDNHSITLSSATKKDSTTQSQTLEITTDDILVNGKSISSIGTGGSGETITDDHIKDVIQDTTGVPNWDDFRDHIDSVSNTVQEALKNANQAISEARDAANKAQQAGDDAQLAGQNAANSVDDLKKHLVYYMSISPEKDVYVPGKYLILNEDVTVKNGFVKEAYIDDAAISTAKIKDAAITNAKIADLAVHTAQIADGAITNAKIGNLAVDTAQIADGAIIDAKVGHLSFEHMEGELLDASKIRVSHLQGDSIEAGTIRADKLIINNLSEISSDLGNITNGTINAGQGNVTIDNLPADDPTMLTPEKKAQLQNTVNSLRSAVTAQVDFQNSIGAPANTCDVLKNKMNKLSSDVTPYFKDMNSTEKYDNQLINNDIDEVNQELNRLSNSTIKSINTTADGKNTIYTGAFAPSNPKLGDIWAKPSSDGSSEGTFEIYGENGWFSPTQDVYDRLQDKLSKQPKNYYQSGEPTGDIVEGSIWYKTKVDALNNVSFDMYVYQDGKWVAYSDDALKGINTKLDQVAQTANGKNNIYSSNNAPTNPKDNDIWIDTGHDNAIKVYINGQWVSPNANQDQINDAVNSVFDKVPNIYYQATAPTGDIVEGSTWYKTGDNNTYVMYTYKNGKWVSLLDDNINTAVNNATNSINSSVDNKITNATNSINNSIDSKLDNFSFGSRNLLRKSQSRDDGDLYIKAGTLQADKFLGANVYETHSPWNSQEFRVQDLVNRNIINTDDYYTFSTYVKYTGDNPSPFIYFFHGDRTIAINTEDTSTNVFKDTKPNVWNQVSFTFKFNSLTPPSSGKFYVGYEFFKNGYNGNVYWTCPKLEKGTKATDYSIAPEDIDTSLTDNKNAINSANTSINGIQGNINNINSQLSAAQSQLKGLTTVNYVPNSDMATNISTGAASTGGVPYDWKAIGNASMAIAGWSRQPLGVTLGNTDGTPVDLTKDYSDTIMNGYIRENDGTIASYGSNPFYQCFNKMFSAKPKDTIKIQVYNREKYTTSGSQYNSIAFFDINHTFVTSINFGNLNGSDMVKTFTVPNDCYYFRVGWVMGGSNNNYGMNSVQVTYTPSQINAIDSTNLFKDTNGSNIPVDNNHWILNCGDNASNATSVVSENLTNAKITKVFKVTNPTTITNGNGFKFMNIPQVNGTPYVLSFWAKKGDNTAAPKIAIRNTNIDKDETQVETYYINNTQYTFYQYSWVATDSKTDIAFYNKTPNCTVYFANPVLQTGVADYNNLIQTSSNDFKNGFGNWIHGDTISITDNTLMDTKVVNLAPNGSGTNYLSAGIFSGITNDKAYCMSFWAKGDPNTILHFEERGNHYGQNIKITNNNIWNYYELPFMITKEVTSSPDLLKTYIYNKSTSGNIQVANIKICEYNTHSQVNGWLGGNATSRQPWTLTAKAANYHSGYAILSVRGNDNPQVFNLGGTGHYVYTFDTNGHLLENRVFGDYSNTDQQKALVTYLNGLTGSKIVAIFSADATTITNDLRTWLNNHGGDPSIGTFSSQRYSHVYIGRIDDGKPNNSASIEVINTNTGSGNGAQASVTFNDTKSINNGSITCQYYEPLAPNSWVFLRQDQACAKNYYYFYDRNGKFLTGQEWGNGNNRYQTIKVPTGAYYIRTSSNATTEVIQYNKPFDIVPRVQTSSVQFVTSTHNSFVQAGSEMYNDNVIPYLEWCGTSNFDSSNKDYGLIRMNKVSGVDGLNYDTMNHKVDVLGTGWTAFARILYLPCDNWYNTGNVNGIIYKGAFITISQGTLSSMPPYVATHESLSTSRNSVQKNTSYNGVTINDKGISITSGNNKITMNANVGIDIYGNSQHNMSIDNQGNLVMRGNLVAGNISGVNIGGVTFTGNNMNLNNVLNVNGAIKSNGVTIDNKGLHVTDGDITLGSSSNSLTKNAQITSGWISANGWQNSNQDCGYRMIPVTGGATITISVGQVPDPRRNQLAFYDSTQTLIGSVTGCDFTNNKSATVTAPSNAKYMSFATYVGNGNVSTNYPIYIYQSGNTNTLLMSDGTLITKNAVFENATSKNVNIIGGTINMTKKDGSVAFSVDNNGNASFSGNLSGVNITGNNSTLSGTLAVNGTLSAAAGNVILNNDGLTINKGSINISNGSGTTFRVSSDGSLLANNATITGNISAHKLTIASNADVSINVNGQFTVDNKGNVYAGSLTLKNGNISSSSFSGGNIYGSTLHLGNSYWNNLWQDSLYNTQYDEHGIRTGFSYEGGYGGSDGTRHVKVLNYMSYWVNDYGNLSYGQYNDGWYRDALQVDCSQFKDGDTVLIQMKINYDNPVSQQGTIISMNVKGKNPYNAYKYFGNGNTQQVNTGEYTYTWYFTYHSDLGNGTITLEHKVDHFFKGSRMYITQVNLMELPIEQNADGLMRLGFSADEISTRSQVTSINGGSTFKQTYMVDSTSGKLHKLRVASAELGKGLLKFNTQTARYSTTGDENSFPYSSLYISGEGMAYFGDGNAAMEFAYDPTSIISLWGSVRHEALLANGGTGSDWAIHNGNGISINRYGNIELMAGSDNWNINSFGGANIARFYNNGNTIIGNVKSTLKNTGNQFIKTEYNNGHLTVGGAWGSFFGAEGQANNNVELHTVRDHGWYQFRADIQATVHSWSLRSLKKDITPADDKELLDAVLSTDIGKYHFKKKDYNTSSYHYTPIIEDEDVKEFNTNNIFIDDSGESLDVQSLIGALISSVKELQKQVSDLNIQLLKHELEDNQK